MKKNLLFVFATLLVLCCNTICMEARTFVGQKFNWVCEDSVFKNPYIDEDVILTSATGLKVHYMHGGFDDGTRFSFYFPTVRVTNSRSGQPETFAQIQNVGRVQLIVEL